ncbi:MAG TPA: ATPase [Kiritimatiellia bacterium]|nr:ATPase [Kiritimatiellia bacterium]HMP34482.1 ATPase [Kiritimatiellia bacterium]
MAEELQHLIERIQREAVDTGEQQAAKIVAQAREKAAALVKDAEAKAAAIVEKADQDAKLFTQRSEQALSQAARDLLISVGRGVEQIFEQLTREAAGKALDAATLRPVLARIMEVYAREGGLPKDLEVIVGEADRAAITDFFKQEFAAALAGGLAITVDPRTQKGFKVRRHDRHIEHDFSREAIADAVAAYLRPVLAETVYNVSRAS